MSGGVVVPLFATKVAERAAERLVPSPLHPQSLSDYRQAGALQLARDQRTDSLGTWVAVAAGVGAFFVVRDWRSRQRQRRTKGST